MTSPVNEEYLAAVAAATLEPMESPVRGHGPAICALEVPPSPPIGWVASELWPAGELGVIGGDGGGMKTTVATHISAAIAGGYRVFDRFETIRRPVIIVSAEDPIGITSMRLEALARGHGWDRTRVLKNVHLIADGDPSLASLSFRRHLLQEVARLRAGFVVLDPWAELIDGEENSNSEARSAIKYMREITRVAETAVCVVHHAGKAGQDKRTLDRIRGATALPNAARVIFFFEWRDDGIGVENLKQSRAPRLSPFTIERDIHSRPENRGDWISARLTVGAADEHALTRADRFVLAQLKLSPTGRRTSTELRDLGAGAGGTRKQEIASALTRLHALGRIDFEAGARGARHWFVALARPQSTTLPNLAHDPARAASPCDLAHHPFRGGGNGQGHDHGDRNAEAGQGHIPLDVLAEHDERLGMMEG